MSDMENVINGLNDIGGFIAGRVGFAQARNFLRTIDDAIALLKEQKKQKFFVDSNGKITPLPDVVRCKDCIHRGKSEKCVLAAISEEKNFPLFMLDNRGEWFCADGKRR